MKKNGFTLIEIIGVITLLGLIALIVFPTVKGMIDDSKQKLYDEQINQIEASLKNWGSSNVFLLPEENETITLSLGQLKLLGHANVEIKNPKTNKCFSNESLLTITKYNNSYIYDASNVFDVDCELIEDAPTIELNGSVVEYLNIGDSYVDAGATAKSSNGSDISGSITTTISGTGTTIDTTVVGNYTITYGVTDNGKTMIVIRTVIVDYPYKNGIMSSSSNCINEGTCANGTSVTVKVNNTQSYNFYTIKDTGNELTLIMDRNLGSQVDWISKVDYNDDTNYGDYGNNNKGPITVLNYLNSQTTGWTNIPVIESYTYVNNENGTTNTYGYQKLVITNGVGKLTSQDGTVTTTLTGISRARLLTYEEYADLRFANSNTVPTWLYTNLSSSNTTDAPAGYWFLTASPKSRPARYLVFEGGTDYDYVYYGAYYLGARPVITLSK